MGNLKYLHILAENFKASDSLEEVGLTGRITLKRKIRYEVVDWTELA
jgi:hypothetical protein